MNLKTKIVNDDALAICFLLVHFFPLLPNQIYSDSTAVSSLCWLLFEMTKCAIIFTLGSPLLLLSPCWRSNVCHWARFYSWNSKRILFLLFLRCGILFPAAPTPPSLCCSSVISSGSCPTFHSQWRFLSVFHLPVKFFLKSLLYSLPIFSSTNTADCTATVALWEVFLLDPVRKQHLWPNQRLTPSHSVFTRPCSKPLWR